VSSPDERAALVALLRNGKRPWQLYADLVEEAGSALAVLEEESQQDAGQASLFPADHRSALRTARDEIEAWETHGLELLTVLDPGYPDNLRAVHDRPPLIFVAGSLKPTDSRAVAVVGARTPSPEGVKTASAIATHLAARDYAVASGLAAGIDTAAHTAALTAGGRTLAVIGTGLNRSYPPENAALQRRIAAEGAVISQFWPDAPPSRRSFPMRNAVMSGLALTTVVVEASHTSGSRMQARLALAHGRPVCLLGSLVEQHEWARAFAQLPGAHVVRSPEEITDVVERLSPAGTLVL
jgi:DNA processing protein